MQRLPWHPFRLSSALRPPRQAVQLRTATTGLKTPIVHICASGSENIFRNRPSHPSLARSGGFPKLNKPGNPISGLGPPVGMAQFTTARRISLAHYGSARFTDGSCRRCCDSFAHHRPSIL